MKIGIDISQTAHSNSGVARYMVNLTKLLCQFSNKNTYYFFYSSLRKPINSDLKNVIQKSNNKLITYSIPPTILSFLWNNIRYPLAEKLIGDIDVFITSDWMEAPSKKAKMTIVHDLVFHHYPDTVHKTIYKNMVKRLSLVKNESHLIVVDSHSTKNDLITFYNIKKHKIMVIYPYVDISEAKITPYEILKQKYCLHSKYILTVGKIEPRKNLQRLIEAYLSIKNSNKYELLICGPKGWGNISLKNKNHVRLLGEIPDQDLYALYQHAVCFVYPSLYEGFGYPVVEAMSMGCPVATSNTSSLQEIGKNSSILFNPFSVSEIKNALETLMYNMSIRKEYSRKGKIRAAFFNKNLFLSLFNSAIEKAYDNWYRRK